MRGLLILVVQILSGIVGILSCISFRGFLVVIFAGVRSALIFMKRS